MYISTKEELRGIAAAMPWGAPSPVSSVTVDHLTRAISKIKPEILALFAEETGYAPEDCEALWQAVEGFLDGLNTLIATRVEAAARETAQAAQWFPGAEIRYEPWGRVLVCLPANAPVPLAVIIPLALLAGGNAVVVAASGKARRTALSLAEVVAKFAEGRIAVFDGRVRDAVTALTEESTLIDTLYFMGGSGHYPEIAATCARAGVHLIYEGEGRGVAVIDETLSREELQRAAELILSSKRFCNGQMCSAPNVIAVARSAMADFQAYYSQLAREMRFPAPVREFTAPAVWEKIEARLSNTEMREFRHPFLVPTTEFAEAMRSELFCPVAYVTPFDDFSRLVSEIGGQRYRLQVSLFTTNQERQNALLRATRFARYCYWMVPSDQHPLLPWGNYGLSGHSDVLDFYSKGLRRVIIESAASAPRY